AGVAGRIQRNRAGVSWHTTLLAKSSVLYLCEGEGGGMGRFRAILLAHEMPLRGVSTTQKGWQMVRFALVCQPFALCGAKVYHSRFSSRYFVAFGVMLKFSVHSAAPRRNCFAIVKIR